MAQIYSKSNVGRQSGTGMYAGRVQGTTRVKSRSMTSEQRAAIERDRAKRRAARTTGTGNRVAVFSPGTRPATKVGSASYIGPTAAMKLRSGSSLQMKGGSVQNRRRAPKTYI